jgi:anti-sigma-K factor RskA
MTRDQNRNDELLLRQYLLGRLAEEEQGALEQQLMTNQDLFNRLLKAEEELIDEYVRGQVSDDEGRAFEGRFLEDPGRWDELQFAEVLRRYLARHYSAPHRSPPSVDRKPK